MPLLGVLAMVVEFFATIRIPDVAVEARTNGVVAKEVGGNRDVRPFGTGILKQGHQAVALQVAWRLQPGEFR